MTLTLQGVEAHLRKTRNNHKNFQLLMNHNSQV